MLTMKIFFRELEKVKGKIFDLNLFNKLMVFVNPYKLSFYGVMASAIIISILSTLTPIY
ncbi:MAG: hypothetical protein CM15mP102_11650 [Flavobacteriales bacterium]|nr:MAG: hypothetical protein CM15mP102_11650 [Flavobacteriales bacterium]